LRGAWSTTSAQPPRRPISTTRVRIRESSLFLTHAKFVRYVQGGWMDAHLVCSSSSFCSQPAPMASIRLFNSLTSFWRSSSWSSTSSRRLASDRLERHDSVNMRPAATANRKASAREFAPFWIALTGPTISTIVLDSKYASHSPSLTQRLYVLG
jgi:hypothetical protein